MNRKGASAPFDSVGTNSVSPKGGLPLESARSKVENSGSVGRRPKASGPNLLVYDGR